MKTLTMMVLAIAIGFGFTLPGCAAERGVREPAVAGAFYPDDATKLEAAIRGFFEDAMPARGEKPIAIVVPHAGYVYSGQIAADAFAQAKGHPYDLVVILGTNHTVPPFDGVSVFQGVGYRTPLGVAKIDQEFARSLADADPSFRFRPEAHASEHSVEVQVPFVQVAFPKARIVTAIVGDDDSALVARFGKTLARLLSKRNALIVASSDLSHYPDYEDAVEADRATLTAIASVDPSKTASAIRAEERKGRPSLVTCACGKAPILAAMHAARDLGATRGIVVSYANSGDTVAGEPDRVVGYGAVVFAAGAGGSDTKALDRVKPAAGNVPLSAGDHEFLLNLARKTLERWYATGIPPLPRSSSHALHRDQGAFVTLNVRGNLRGCIGHMAEDTPLMLTVARMAIDAATRDPRFRPVRANELPSIDISISALTPMTRVDGPDAIEVGRDGALIDKGGRRAVFLPQVAPEQGWGRDEMLDNLCMKAGMAPGCWRKGTTFYTFQADEFEEKKRH